MFFITHSHDISVWTILSRILHSHAPHLGGMNGDVQYYLYTPAFNNGEQLEYFNGRIFRPQQEIILPGEIVSPTRILFEYTKTLSNSDKIRAFIAPKMTDIIKFLDNNVKSAVYTGWNINGIYCYLETIESPTKLTTSGQRSRNFSLLSSINND